MSDAPNERDVEALTKVERDLIIDTGRHVYGCCADDCEYHGLPEDAQIRAVERILAERIAQARREGAAEDGDARGRTATCLPFCHGGLHEVGCAALRGDA